MSGYEPVPSAGENTIYAIKIAKVVVGGVRFVLEDSLQAICQGIYLCKRWLKLSTSTRLFTMASISVGIFLSLVGPLKEWCGLKRPDFFTDADAKEGSRGCDIAHCVLSLMAGVFWGSMAAYSYAYGDDITCEGDNPDQPLRLFIGFVVFDLCAQIFVVMVQGGVSLGGCLEGIIFTCLARYDTFADVVFTARLNDCEDITWFSIWGTKFTIPFPLQDIALFALIVGVFVCQALPALCLIVCSGSTPMALKFNDFNVVLVSTLPPKERLLG